MELIPTFDELPEIEKVSTEFLGKFKREIRKRERLSSFFEEEEGL